MTVVQTKIRPALFLTLVVLQIECYAFNLLSGDESFAWATSKCISPSTLNPRIANCRQQSTKLLLLPGRASGRTCSVLSTKLSADQKGSDPSQQGSLVDKVASKGTTFYDWFSTLHLEAVVVVFGAFYALVSDAHYF